MLKDILLRPHGSRFENFTTGLGTSIVDFDPAMGKPERLSADYGTLQVIERMEADEIATMFRLGKVNPIAQGIIPPRTAHDTYEEAVKRNAQELSPIQSEIFHADSELRKKEVLMAKMSGLFEHTRLAYTLLQDGSSFVDEYSDYDLVPGLEYHYKPEQPMPQTPEDRRQDALQLWQMGAFTRGPEFDAMRQSYMRYVATGEIGAFADPVLAYARVQAVMLVTLIRDGGVQVIEMEQPLPDGTFEKVPEAVGPNGEMLFAEWQIHEVYADTLQEMIQQPSTTEDQRQIALLLLSKHSQAIQAAAEDARKQNNIEVAEQSQAEMAGNAMAGMLAANVKKTSAQGGQQSGRVRAVA